MTRKYLLATTAGMVLGAMISAGPAFADLPTIDVIYSVHVRTRTPACESTMI